MDNSFYISLTSLENKVRSLREQTMAFAQELDQAWQGNDAKEYQSRLSMICDMEDGIANQIREIAG